MRESKHPVSVFFSTGLQRIFAYIRKNLSSLPDREKMQQEINSLLRIDDSFQKIVITGGNTKPWMDNNGIQFLNIYDFLLEDLFE